MGRDSQCFSSQDCAKKLVAAALSAADEVSLERRKEIWYRVAQEEALGLVRAASDVSSLKLFCLTPWSQEAFEKTSERSEQLHSRAKRLVTAAIFSALETHEGDLVLQLKSKEDKQRQVAEKEVGVLVFLFSIQNE